MKKLGETILTATSAAAVLLAVMLVWAFQYDPVGNFVFGIIGGSVYRKVGEAKFEAKGYPSTLAVYKAERKPFLIVGPCLFHESGDHYEDFFFVNKTEVVRTATDKGGDMWGRTFDRLHIIDDLSDCEALRAPCWYDLKCRKNSSTPYDAATDSYVFSFTIEMDTVPAKLTIPAIFFTPDMDDAPNRLREN